MKTIRESSRKRDAIFKNFVVHSLQEFESSRLFNINWLMMGGVKIGRALLCKYQVFCPEYIPFSS